MVGAPPAARALALLCSGHHRAAESPSTGIARPRRAITPTTREHPSFARQMPGAVMGRHGVASATARDDGRALRAARIASSADTCGWPAEFVDDVLGRAQHQDG